MSDDPQGQCTGLGNGGLKTKHGVTIQGTAETGEPAPGAIASTQEVLRRFGELSAAWIRIENRRRKREAWERTQWDAALSQLVETERSLRRLGRWTQGPSDLMDVLGLSHHEVRNCKVIRWLLDPTAPHGLGTSFLKRVLDRLSDCSPDDDLSFRDLELAEVEVEEHRVDTRADIIIRETGRTILIEAKINAPEGDDQGHSLEERWTDEHPVHVFLTLDRRPMDTGKRGWLPLSWGDLENDLDASLEEASGDSPGLHAAIEYRPLVDRS